MSTPKKINTKITAQENEDTYVVLKKMDLDSGWLGKVFGTPPNSNVNIAGLIALLLVLTALVFTMFNLNAQDKSPVFEFWKIITPIVGTVLGYLFGNANSR